MTSERHDPIAAAARNGVELIGADQPNVAYTVVADYPSMPGHSNFTATGHKLKKRQTVYIAAGAYAGTYPIAKVISANNVVIKVAFGATDARNFELKASLNGIGFYVDTATALVIEEFEPEVTTVNVEAIKNKDWRDGEYFGVPFKKIRVSGADITVVRGPIKAELNYTNR